MGPTTTEWDRTMVALLAKIAKVDDVQALASEQFKAKSKQLASLTAHQACRPTLLLLPPCSASSPYSTPASHLRCSTCAPQLANGDCKTFGIDGAEGAASLKVGFGVIETTDDGVIMARREELLSELNSLRGELGVQVLFLAVVNIVELKSKLLCAGPAEQSLAAAAFGGEVTEGGTVMDLGALVSRKKEFVPPLTTAVLKGGWVLPEIDLSATDDVATVLVVDPSDPHGRVVRQTRPAPEV